MGKKKAKVRVRHECSAHHVDQGDRTCICGAIRCYVCNDGDMCTICKGDPWFEEGEYSDAETCQRKPAAV